MFESFIHTFAVLNMVACWFYDFFWYTRVKNLYQRLARACCPFWRPLSRDSRGTANVPSCWRNSFPSPFLLWSSAFLPYVALGTGTISGSGVLSPKNIPGGPRKDLEWAQTSWCWAGATSWTERLVIQSPKRRWCEGRVLICLLARLVGKGEPFR